MTRTELVVSELLTAHPVVPAEVGGPLLRALGLVERDPDFAASLDAGFVEDVDAWAARVLIPRDWAQRLAFAACWSLVVLAAHVAWLEARLAEAGAR